MKCFGIINYVTKTKSRKFKLNIIARHRCDYCGHGIIEDKEEFEIQPSTGARYHKECLIKLYNESIDQNV